MKTSLSQLHAWLTGAKRVRDARVDGVSTDSRNILAGNLFVALRGERFDAHDFLPDVVAKGAAAVMVERLPEGLQVPALVVPDTRVALGELARQWRRQFAIPLIGVTGSNGKTTVKEMIAAIFQAAHGTGHYLATRGNLNNEIGVPLTLLQLSADHRAAVIEMGMNHVGEIAVLSAIAQPTVGLVNNAQREHQEFMHSVEAVARENGAVLEALPDDGIAVFPADDEHVSIWRSQAWARGHRRTVTFGFSGEADVTCEYRLADFGSDLYLRVNQERYSLRLSAAGVHNVRNAIAAAACCHAIGIGPAAIASGLESFVPVGGRMQRRPAADGFTVIDDTYNANPDSVLAAIEVLAQEKAPRILVLGDMGEVGAQGRQFHEEVGARAARCGLEHLLTFGTLSRHAATAFGTNARHFDDLENLMASLRELLTQGGTVLVKGSRFMQMERVVRRLVNETTGETH